MVKVLIPGSFDPLHNGHVDIVDQALELPHSAAQALERAHTLCASPPN